MRFEIYLLASGNYKKTKEEAIWISCQAFEGHNRGLLLMLSLKSMKWHHSSFHHTLIDDTLLYYFIYTYSMKGLYRIPKYAWKVLPNLKLVPLQSHYMSMYYYSQLCLKQRFEFHNKPLYPQKLETWATSAVFFR